MKNEDIISEIQRDINYESEDLEPNYDLIGKDWINLKLGDKIGWLYKDEHKFYVEEFSEEMNGDFDYWIKNEHGLPFEGILFTFPDNIFRIDENAVVCCYDWPVEKENPDCFWVSLDRLLSNKDIYKVYKL